MYKVWMVVLLAMVMVAPTGCNSSGGGTTPPVVKKLTPEQITKLCNDGGQMAALAWVAKVTPTPDQVKAVKIVLDEIGKAMTGFQGGSFTGMLPQIDEAIKKAFPGTDERSLALQKMAHLFASDTLTALDDLFAQHPDWDKKGNIAAGYVNAFTTGASAALDDFVAKSDKAMPQKK